MLWRAALVSWLVIIAGLALVFAYSDVDQLFNLGLALTVLGPLIALGVVIWQRTPEAVERRMKEANRHCALAYR